MKKIIIRSLLGSIIGVFISFAITVIISLCVADGFYYPVVPELTDEFGSEISAVVVQSVMSMLMGAVFGGASVIWETDWSITKMTLVHFILISVTGMTVAYFLRWMPRNLLGILTYIGIFVAIYAFIWIVYFISAKKKVDAINKKIVK